MELKKIRKLFYHRQGPYGGHVHASKKQNMYKQEDESESDQSENMKFLFQEHG